MGKREWNRMDRYAFMLSNLERDLYGRYASMKRAFIRDRGVELSSLAAKRRVLLGTMHTLDMDWDMNRFKEELETINWGDIFHSENEMDEIFNENPELTYMYHSSNET